MSKMIVYGEEARKKLQSGIDQLACISICFIAAVYCILFSPFKWTLRALPQTPAGN